MGKELAKGNTESETAKTRYFSRFALRNFSDMKILKKGGVLGKENEAWRNISEHCLVEAVGADILAEVLGADRETVRRAAILHDWNKRQEIEAMNNGKDYDSTLSSEEKTLLAFGIPEAIVKLSHANVLESTNPAYLEGRTMEEKILHFIDLITGESDFLEGYKDNPEEISGNKRRKIIEFYKAYESRYAGKNILEVQKEVGEQEQEEFEKKLGITAGTISRFIKEKLEERIRSSS